MELFDSHAHYNDEKFNEDRDEVLNRIYKNNVTSIVCAGYNLESSIQAVNISRKYSEKENYPIIYTSCGISPNDIESINIDDELTKMEKLFHKNKDIIKEIGEIGLDYYWNKDNKERQKEIFIKQIEFANELDLPIVIHTRDAIMDTLDVIKNQKQSKNKGVFHCCPLNIELIKEGLKLGYYISFSGNITFKNSRSYETIKDIPIERILIETDSPYLTPEPYRGKRNNSEYVKFIAHKIAEIKNMKINDVAKITYENTKNILKIN